MIAGAAGRKAPLLYRFLSESPWYVDSGEGATITDVDGRSYIDLMGSYGPNLLGHRHPRVEQAATRQRLLGDSMGGAGSGGGRAGRVPLCPVRARRLGLRREERLRRDELRACVWLDWHGSFESAHRGGLLPHGSRLGHHLRGWCSRRLTAASPARFVYNDAESLRAAVDAADGDVATIMLTPFHQGYFDASAPHRVVSEGDP